MTITFYSNFLNHHQLPFCLEMVKRTDNNFIFVATSPINKERLDLGYEDMNKKYPFVLTAYDSKENEDKAMKLALESDVIIHGSAPEGYITQRMKTGKLTFRYSERIYKRGVWRAFHPRAIKAVRDKHTKYKNDRLYMLCASAYTAGDFAILNAYKKKCYKWGYFPQIIQCDIDKLIKEKEDDKINLLWCARFIDWKHPEKAIQVAKRLKDDGYDFRLNMIGIGTLYEQIKSQINEMSLQNEVTLLGAMTQEKVREYMGKANIFLFTSDYNEGWGAVLNEAMNSACAVVASHAIGAVPYLIENEKNGHIYKNNDNEDLYVKVKKFMDSKNLRQYCGKNAYSSLKNIWNAKSASENLIKLCAHLLYGEEFDIKEGPCSREEGIPQRKMYKSIVKRC